MAQVSSDTVKEIYEVLYGPRVPCRTHPDSKSQKVTTKEKGELVETDAWDDTRNWRRVWVENDAGEIQAAWMQVMSDALGQLLLSIGPATNDVADEPDPKSPVAIPTESSGKRLGRFSQLAAGNVCSDEEGTTSQKMFVELPSGITLPPKSSSSQLYVVVFEPHVAVRAFPSMTAPAMRALKCGTVVRLFEWDKQRKWRRVTLPTQVEDWHDSRGCCKLEDVDGWILVVHPVKGTLLEAVLTENTEGAHMGKEDNCKDEGKILSEERDASRLHSAGRDSLVRDTDTLDAIPSQVYKVVFKPRIPVRTSPSTAAPAMRALQHGAKVRCFEWDATSSWRRVTMPRQIEADSDPHICRLQESDGWVLVNHPSQGPLLEVVAEETSQPEESVGNLNGNSNREQPQDNCNIEQEVTECASNVNPVVAMALAALKESKGDLGYGILKHTQPIPPNNTLVPQHLELISSVERKPGEPLIMQATRSGHLTVVESLLKSFANPNAVDAFGETSLFEAAASAHTDIVARLLICKVDSNHVNQDGMTALAITTDSPTRALMMRFKGETADDAMFRRAFQKLADIDQKRLMQLLKISDPLDAPFETNEFVEEKKPETSQSPPIEPLATCGNESKESGALLFDLHKHSGKASGDQLIDTILSQEARKIDEPAVDLSRVDQILASKVSSANEVSIGPQAAEEELDIDERGVPRRTEVPTYYKVAYKMVAVRKFPNTKAPQIRAKMIGDVVEMFEWDHTRLWRRVVTTMVDEENGDGKLIPTDGWMLTYSQKLGPLLQQIPKEELNDVDEEEEVAG
mmetsp:Transcript_10274/g.16791  ORF Transcript_10274/g.16791 Transcript_10274/m.16791 type:complete len:801 (+) Transcript_10274:69-2471(+)